MTTACQSVIEYQDDVLEYIERTFFISDVIVDGTQITLDVMFSVPIDFFNETESDANKKRQIIFFIKDNEEFFKTLIANQGTETYSQSTLENITINNINVQRVRKNGVEYTIEMMIIASANK